MHASHDYTGNGSKVTKIAIVTALHLGVALGLLSMKIKVPEQVHIITNYRQVDPPKTVEPKIQEPDLNTKKAVVPDIIIPLPFIDIADPKAPIVTAKVDDGPARVAEPTSPGTPEGTRTGPGPDKIAPKERTFSAALANASDCIRPDYPARSVRNGDSGTVSLALLIGTDGKVTEAKVQRSSGHKELDRAAVSALSMCKFKPAMTNGVAEPAWGQIAYVWSLAD